MTPRCDHGWRPCPGACIKRGVGDWVRNPVPGENYGKMAFRMRTPGATTYVLEGHVGEVWVVRNGQAVSLGACPTCRGSSRVLCAKCQGAGKLPCDLCAGSTAIPAEWEPTNNPWFNRQPDVVRLRDGRVFLGRDVGGDELLAMFRTRAGEIITVPRAEVTQFPKPE